MEKPRLAFDGRFCKRGASHHTHADLTTGQRLREKSNRSARTSCSRRFNKKSLSSSYIITHRKVVVSVLKYGKNNNGQFKENNQENKSINVHKCILFKNFYPWCFSSFVPKMNLDANKCVDITDDARPLTNFNFLQTFSSSFLLFFSESGWMPKDVEYIVLLMFAWYSCIRLIFTNSPGNRFRPLGQKQVGCKNKKTFPSFVNVASLT